MIQHSRTLRHMLLSGALVLVLSTGALHIPFASSFGGILPVAVAQEEPEKSLFSPSTTPEEFAAALQKARTEGVPEQELLEAQIIRAFYDQDKTALATLLPSLQAIKPTLNTSGSQLFQTVDDYDSLVEGISALSAEQKGDDAAFEKHIKEALWLGSSTLQSVYLSWLNSYRNSLAMQKITVPLETELQDSDGKTTTLKAVLGDKKALLIDFWAEWCAPCMNAMEELNANAAKLAPQGIVTVGLNTEDNGVPIAARVKKDKGMNLPWLVEPEGQPYSRLLGIDTIPRAVLISPEGKVLYNGHPSDPALKSALKKLGTAL